MKQKDIYDWNRHDSCKFETIERSPMFHDETLRDGLQSPSIKIPTVSQRVKLLHYMDELKIQSADIGFPAAGALIKKDVLAIAKAAKNEQLKISLSCAARTLAKDIEPISDISQKVGIQLEVFIFVASSMIRQYVENWSLRDLINYTCQSISFAKKKNLTVTYVTEDTTRSHPEHLEQLYFAAIESGATRICLCDTVGHATPHGVFQLVKYIRERLNQRGFTEIQIDFHGHMDRGLGVWNSIMAYIAGASRLHGCGLGIGERCGNTPIDQLLVNCRLMELVNNDLTVLTHYLSDLSSYTGIPIPANYPIAGTAAFETATGVHAAALLKALKRQLPLADQIYSGVPASWFGQTQSIKIGSMSGRSNVIYWLDKNNLPIDEEVIDKILARAKQANTLLNDDEIWRIVNPYYPSIRKGAFK